MPNHDFLLFICGGITRARTIYQHYWMDATKEVVGVELEMKTHASIAVATALASLEPHGHIVISTALIINDRAWESVIAHDVRQGVQQGGIGWGKNHPDVVSQWQVGLTIIHGVKGRGIGAARGISGDSTQAIACFNIELNCP